MTTLYSTIYVYILYNNFLRRSFEIYIDSFLRKLNIDFKFIADGDNSKIPSDAIIFMVGNPFRVGKDINRFAHNKIYLWILEPLLFNGKSYFNTPYMKKVANNIKDMLKNCDVSILCYNKIQIESFEKISIKKCEYLPIGYDTSSVSNRKQIKIENICFAGTIYGQRKNFFDKLLYDVYKIIDSNSHQEFINKISEFKIGIAIQDDYDNICIPWQRLMFYVSNNVVVFSDMALEECCNLVDGVDYIYYDTKNINDKLKILLDNSDSLEKIAQSAKNNILKNFTMAELFKETSLYKLLGK